MRWYWFDRFVEFESGRHAVAIKNVAMAEDQLHDTFPGRPLMPSSLILEGLAQVGGILVGELNQFEERVVLAKVTRARFHEAARPGDTLTYRAEIDSVGAEGAFILGSSHLQGELQAEVEFYLAFLSDRNGTRAMFEPADFLRLLRAFRLFEVARGQDGNRLEIPARLLAAEEASNNASAARAT
jgi:3-hydroxyacyl-[acyl-carrier-protein] dehydratase